MIDRNEIRPANQRTLSVGVVGAGSIGLSFAARLGMAGHKVFLVARGQSRDVIERKGIVLTDPEGTHTVRVECGSVEEMPVVDVLLLCVKAYDLLDACRSIKDRIGAGTTVVPIVNGVPWWYFALEGSRFEGRTVNAVDSSGELLQMFDPRQILGAVTTTTAERTEVGQVRSLSPMAMVLGELNHTASDRATMLAARLSDARIMTRASTCIRDAVWTKLVQNLMTNPLSVVSQASIGEMCTSERLSGIVRRIAEETFLLAAAFGARIAHDPDTLIAGAAEKGSFKTSMLQDYQRGHLLETEAICAAVAELAELKGISMPMTTTIADLTSHLAGQRLAA